jgi:ABC-2 type transport system permease protein
MAGNSAFQMVEERGWRRGVENLMRAGFASWWKTNTWWIHALVWTVVFNGMMGGLLWGASDVDVNEGAMLYSIFTGIFAAVAVIIIMQSQIVGEKQSGTAAWVLSKPVSRAAFILSKLVPNAVGVLATMLLAPGAVAFVQLSMAGADVSLGGFVAGMAVLGLNLLFYLALTLMLGTLFNKRGGVLAISLGFAFGQQYFLGLVPAAVHVLPWTLAIPVDDSFGAISTSLMLGRAPQILSPVVVAICLVFLFVAVSLWRFENQEL